MATLRVVRRLAAAVVLLGALFGATAAPSGALTDPQSWGDTFCSETVTWLTGALEGAQSVQDQAADPSLTPTDGKQLVVQFLDTGVDATKSFGQEVKRAGAPDITNGVKIQSAILAGIAGSGAKLTVLHKAAKALPTKPPKAFERSASRLGKRLRTFADPFQKGLSTADELDEGNELGNILEARPACAPLVDGSLTNRG